MPGKLHGLKVVVPESRELDLFAGLLEAEDAIAVRCPLVKIVDLDDTGSLDAWLDRLLAGEFDDLVLLTGEGLRHMANRSSQLGVRTKFVDALGRVRTIVRGPKPARALRELGLAATVSAPVPTSQGVIDALANQDISGRRIAIQFYPGADDRLILALRERGAVVSAVTPYRYASETESGEVARTIRGMAAGEFGMIAFTSSPQVKRLVDVASQQGLERELAEGFRRVLVAAIGPVVREALEKQGVTGVVSPPDAFHLKPFIRTIVAAWATRSQ